MTSAKSKCEDLLIENPLLKIVSGFYYCPLTSKNNIHWWCITPAGDIIDPSKEQFGYQGMGDYIQSDGLIECKECGKRVKDDDAILLGDEQFCSNHCLISTLYS